MINQTEQTNYRLNLLETQQKKLENQLQTKEKISKGSEDSQLFDRDIHFDEKIETFEGIKTQIQRNSAQERIADVAMRDIKKLFDYIKVEISKGNTGTTSQSGREIIAKNIEGVKGNLLNFANTQTEGEYVFAGSDASVKPFTMDADGKVSYHGDSHPRKVLVDEGRYIDVGVNGFEMMHYTTSQGYKGDTITFKQGDTVIDQDGNSWKFDGASKIVKYDEYGDATTETLNATIDGKTPPTYSVTLPNQDGVKFQTKSNVFDVIDEMITSLRGTDTLGNPIPKNQADEVIGNSIDKLNKIYDDVNKAHADLGKMNKLMEISETDITSKITQYGVIQEDIAGVNVGQVAKEAKELQLLFNAMYATITKTNELSLVNFIK